MRAAALSVQLAATQAGPTESALEYRNRLENAVMPAQVGISPTRPRNPVVLGARKAGGLLRRGRPIIIYGMVPPAALFVPAAGTQVSPRHAIMVIRQTLRGRAQSA